jgi:hypothetical protein
MTGRAGLAKVGFYFDAVPDRADMIREAMAEVAQQASAGLPDGVAARAGSRVDIPLIPHLRVMANAPKPFDFAWQLSVADMDAREAMADAIVAMADTLGDNLDCAHAAILVGREIAITSGDGPVYNIMPLRRLPALDHDEFMRHWFDRHATLGEGVEGVRYRQNHVDYPPTDALAARLRLDFAPMDGLTESYFDSVEAAVAILSQEDVAVGAIEDEKRFIDHGRSQFGIYETVWRTE